MNSSFSLIYSFHSLFQKLLLFCVVLAGMSGWRCFAAGEPDYSFYQQGEIDGPIEAVAVDNQSNIWIAGKFSNVYGQPRRGIAVLDSSGALNPLFTSDTMAGFLLGEIHALAIDGAGNVYAGGENGIVRIRPHSPGWQLDTSFSTAASAWINHVQSIAIRQVEGNMETLWAAASGREHGDVVGGGKHALHQRRQRRHVARGEVQQ